MEIIVTNQTVADEILANLPKNNSYAIGYCTMHPKVSPMFGTTKEVLDWYMHQSTDVKQQFYKSGFMAIYVNQIAIEELSLSYGYIAKKGEILSTDEHMVWEFSTKQWL